MKPLPVHNDIRDLTLDFLRKPTESKWPRFPVLPLKRFIEGKEQAELGYVFYFDATTVYAGNVFLTEEEDHKAFCYKSVEEMIDDGWQID
jgi:hypothetical protein